MILVKLKTNDYEMATQLINTADSEVRIHSHHFVVIIVYSLLFHVLFKA